MNWEPIITAVITSIPPTIVAYAAFRQATKAKQQSVVNHEAINGKMDAFLHEARQASKAAGKLEEHDEQRAREVAAGKNDRRGK